jgi:16S rRNA (guanine527-N7)-methyltransferase
MEWTLIDARRKKIDFLTGAIAELGLGNVRALHVRGEDLARAEPASAGRFELVTAKAVATAAETIAQVRDLVTPGGFVVVHKGPGLTDEEIREGREAAVAASFDFLRIAEPDLPELAPKLLVYRARSAADEGEYDY